MKKIANGLFCLLFAIPVFFAHPVFAATPVTVKSAASPMPTPTPVPGPVEYILPYPGILPTHPLYLFKTLRDRIIEMLITDPSSKAEFYILQADKKLNMGVGLKRTSKTNEAKTAFAESLASRGLALDVLETHKKAGNPNPGHLIEKLKLSLAKHAEVLKEEGQSLDAVVAMQVKAEQIILGDK